MNSYIKNIGIILFNWGSINIFHPLEQEKVWREMSVPSYEFINFYKNGALLIMFIKRRQVNVKFHRKRVKEESKSCK